MRRIPVILLFLTLIILQSNHDLQAVEEVSQDVRKGVKTRNGFLMPMAPENALNKVFAKPQPYDLEGLYDAINEQCRGQDRNCYKSEIIEITKKHGARAAIDVYKRLILENEDLMLWTHHIVHHIGYYNAVTFGAFPEILSLCTEDFQYGCIHGFYQGAALSKQFNDITAKKFSDDFSKNIDKDENFKRAVYHALGHAYMINADYNIPKALDLCDQLENQDKMYNCWGGTFMESEDCALMGDWEKCGYSNRDPLAPCSRIDPKYQESCYFNHTRWLMTLFDNNYKKVISTCEKIPQGKGQSCLQYLMHIVTGPDWQRVNVDDDYPAYSPVTAIHVCRLFPEEDRDECLGQTIFKFRNRRKWKKAQIKEFCGPFVQDEYEACRP